MITYVVDDLKGWVNANDLTAVGPADKSHLGNDGQVHEHTMRKAFEDGKRKNRKFIFVGAKLQPQFHKKIANGWYGLKCG